MNTIERIAIGAISAIISATLLFVETAPVQPLLQNSTPSYDSLVKTDSVGSKQIASTRQDAHI